MIPGMNLLAVALTAIGSQPVVYYRYTGSTTDGAGREVSQYAPARPVMTGSVQTIPREKYDVLGLEMARTYYNWFVPADVTGIGRDCAGDQIEYNGMRLQLTSETPWYMQDGWTSAICVQVNLPT